MNVLRSTLFALSLLVITPPYSLLAIATAPLPALWRYRIISGWSHIVIFLARVLLGIRYRIEGLETLPRQPVVFLSKHQSAWETLAFQVFLPPQVLVLKRELLWIPFFGWGLAMMSPIAIDRSRGTRALKHMADMGRKRLAQGFSIVVYPEGTRVAPRTRKPYQQGGAWLAVKTGAPVVPIAHNAGLLWPKNAFIKRPGIITVKIGRPIPSTGVKPEALTAEVEAWIETHMETLCPE